MSYNGHNPALKPNNHYASMFVARNISDTMASQ
jgi:hypothetical protein